MKERPILFSGEMVRAILKGRKTQTRRIINPQPPDGCSVGWSTFSGEMKVECRRYGASQHQSFIRVPFGRRGDKLWVKETFKTVPVGRYYVYRSDIPKTNAEKTDHAFGPWKPSIFMPRIASRITLEVISIRVERLQDITEADAKAEGSEIPFVNFPQEKGSQFKVGDPLGSYRDYYRCIWNSINGKDSWDKNPWVWVIQFKRIKP